MTSRAHSKLSDRLAQLRAQADSRVAAIVDESHRRSDEAAHEVRERSRATAERLRELEQQKDQEKEQEDPNANNQWMQRRETRHTELQLGDMQEESGEQRPPAVPASPPVEPPRPTQPSTRPPSPRGSRGDDHFDDEDFSNNSWMQ